MDANQRNTFVVVMLGVALVAGAIGFALGRAGGDDGDQAAPPSGSPSSIPIGAEDEAPPPTAPSAAGELLSTDGEVLAEQEADVVAVPENAACTAFVTPGLLGDCGEFRTGGGQAVWVAESQGVGAEGTAWTVRVLTYSADEGGWVTRLGAADPGGSRWSDVGVATADLTGDGGPEIVVGFRDPAGTLEYDIVGVTPEGIAEVLAHAGGLVQGAVTLDGGLADFGGLLVEGEPACCPATFERRTIIFSDGLFRVAEVGEVASGTVPRSQAA